MTQLAEVPAHLLRVDLEKSLVKLDDRWFPAVGICCPPGPEDRPDEPRGARLLAGPARIPNVARLRYGGEIFVPAENGALIEISWGQRGNQCVGVFVKLFARTCALFRPDHPDDLPLWLPHHYHLHQGRLIIERGGWQGNRIRATPGLWEWRDAEPGWVAELIDRISVLPAERGDGPEVELVSLAETWRMSAEDL